MVGEYKQRGGFTADLAILADGVVKTTKYTFNTPQAAEEYALDAEDYHRQLSSAGWRLPNLQSMEVTADLRLRQVWSFVKGDTLEQTPRPQAIGSLINRLIEVPRDREGNIAALPDFGLTNFLLVDDELTLVDTLPPLTTRAGRFPHERLRDSNIAVARHNYDHFWRDPLGAAARTVALGARALGESNNDTSVAEATMHLLNEVPAAHRRDVKQKLLPLYASTLMVRAIRVGRAVI